MSLKLLALTSLYVVVAVFAETWIKGIPHNNRKSAVLHGGGVKIIGGEEAVPNEFPWIVDIQLNNEHHCAGSIISPSWIITSAQCAKGPLKDLVVVAGEHDNSVYEGKEQRRSINRIVIHPNYNQFTFENDIALLKLAVPLDFNEHIGSISYPTPEFQPQGAVVVAGWGSVEEGMPQTSKLQKVDIPLVSDSECQTAFATLGIEIHSSMICAGSFGKDSCYGDAGGPLICTNGDGNKILCGLVSWGIGCGRNFPGVYTRVQFYDPFITEVISETSFESEYFN